MKDIILKIIFANLGNKLESMPYYASAREIAEMITTFIKWLIDEQEIFLGDLSERYITKDNIVVDGKKSLTIDELFTYWKDNVYKKQ